LGTASVLGGIYGNVRNPGAEGRTTPQQLTKSGLNMTGYTGNPAQMNMGWP
jgi:hypothetical protein